MPVEMTHPRYGDRTVKDEQVTDYKRLGWTEGSEVAPDVVDGTVDEVLQDVGDDPVAARIALQAENSRPAPRKSLVTALTRIAAEPNLTSEV